MKKKIWLIPVIAVLLLALILFLPIPQGTYDDGGTREYKALTYKIVKWNRLSVIIDENGQAVSDTYKKTSVYWFPDNRKSISELWEMETADKKLDSDHVAPGIIKLDEVKNYPEDQLKELLVGLDSAVLYSEWGNSDSELSGMYGAVWKVDEDNEIVAYFDDKGRVTDAVLFNTNVIPEVQLHPLYKKYPEYFDLNTFKGLEVYVWQMSGDLYRCGVLSGTNRLKTEEELRELMGNGATIEEMKYILSAYEIEKDEVAIIPIQNPVSSHWYEIDEEYRAKIEAMFWDDKSGQLNESNTENGSDNDDNSSSEQPFGHIRVSSGENAIYPYSRLLWSETDNGDGTLEAKSYSWISVRDWLNGKSSEPVSKIPTLVFDERVTYSVQVNGRVENVLLLSYNGAEYVQEESSFDALSKLPDGTYYVVLDVLLSGNCDPDSPQNSYRYEDVFCLVVGKSKYITKEDGKYILTLPESKKTVRIREEEAEFIPYISDDLVLAAERKITEEVSAYGNNSEFYLQITDGYLCLTVEVIKYIEPPVSSDGDVISGCGYDHEHLFFSERITK